MNSIDALVQPYIDDQTVLGAAVAIIQQGEIVALGGYGKTTSESHGVPVTPHTLFAYGSISKNLCALLIMRLVGQRQLHLDTPIVDYLPDLRFSDMAYGRRVTLRHLLSHTSGLPMAGKYWGPRDPESLRRFVYEQIPHYTFLAAPGSFFLYSNTVFCIAGYIAEAVTGRFYDDLVQDYVFDPLRMARTSFDPVVNLTYPVALPHTSGPDGQPQAIHQMTYNVSGNPSSFALGSVADLANLAQMYLNRGEFADQMILSPASIDEMQTLHASRYIKASAHPLATVNQGFGLGFNVGHYKGKRSARHGGMTQSYNCFFDLFPDDQAGFVLLTNYSDETRLMDLVSSLYHLALTLPDTGIVYLPKPKTIAAPPPHQLGRYRGTFLRIESGEIAAFVIRENTLSFEREGDWVPLVPYDKDQFYAEISEKYRISIAFFFDAKNQITHVMMNGQAYLPIVLAEFEPDLELWKTFEGVYKEPSNSNPQDVFTVRLKEDGLFISEGSHEVPGRALSNRCFLSDFGVIEFEDVDSHEAKLLVWGKATRFYPLDADEYHQNHVIRYLVSV